MSGFVISRFFELINEHIIHEYKYELKLNKNTLKTFNVLSNGFCYFGFGIFAYAGMKFFIF